MGNRKDDDVKLVHESGRMMDVANLTNTELIQGRLSLFGDDLVKIVVTEENLACWIALNNTFTRIGNSDWDTTKHYWNGVLFQLGAYYNNKTNVLMKDLKKIVFEDKLGNPVGSELSNANGEFSQDLHWINVVAKTSSDTRRAPMQLHDLSRLRLDPPVPIHQYFVPYMGGLTFWHDRFDGYTMEATPNNSHDSYTFSCKKTDQLEIEFYKNDEAPVDYAALGAVTIRLVGSSGSDPGDAMNPPQRPTEFTGKTP